MNKPKFDIKCTVSAAAYFVSLAGGVLDMYKMVKFMYILDRESLKRWGYFVTNDTYYGMKHGNVPSMIYGLIKGTEKDDLWNGYFEYKEPKNEVRLVKDDPYFDYMSDAEMELVEEIYGEV